MMAVILSEKRDAETEPSGRQVLIAVGVAVLPILIVLVQNDTGTVLIMGSIALTMIAISGAGNRWVFGLIGGAVLSVLIAIQLGLLKSYQVQRLTAFIDPSANASGSAFNANQARIAALLSSSLMMATALTPHIGYDRAAAIAKHAHQHNLSLRDAALASGYLNAQQFDQWVRPERMV